MKPVIATFFLLLSSTLYAATPTFFISQQNDKDHTLLAQMRPLFFEKENHGMLDTIFKGIFAANVHEQTRLNILNKALLPPYNAQRVHFVTSDMYRIAGLFFKRENATINLIYANGYFGGLTPTKEWACPFSQIFPDFNILSFDWRGIGESEKKDKSFNTDAYRDICGAIEYIKKDNDKPIVLVGFCLGAALSLHATLQAQKEKSATADALVLNCMPSRMNDMKSRIADGLPFVARQIGHTFLIQDFFLPWYCGDLFDLEPREMIKHISLPIYFEHLSDNFATPHTDVYENLKETSVSTRTMLLLSDVGRHVRIHTAAPHQYREAFLHFLEYVGLYPTPH